MAAAAPVSLQRMAPPEEAARGDFHALLARLLWRGPDAALLASLARAEPLPSGADPALAKAWLELTQASSVMDEAAAAAEYDALFAGVGKAPVSIYAGHYAGAMAADHPRVRLQADFARFGLARRETATEPEDHLAGLFEVMRVLAAGGAGRARAQIAEQKRFFLTYLEPAAIPFFEAVMASEHANYYRKVAALGAAFAAIESASFEFETG